MRNAGHAASYIGGGTMLIDAAGPPSTGRPRGLSQAEDFRRAAPTVDLRNPAQALHSIGTVPDSAVCCGPCENAVQGALASHRQPTSNLTKREFKRK